ncbi:hypothetical protein Tco_1022111 [Tanacetum coccineum]
MFKIYNLCTNLVDFADMVLPPRDQRHQYLRFEGLQYTDADIADFEMRLGKIYRREVHRVQVFDFGGLTDLMTEGLSGRMLMEHMDAQGQGVFTSRAWRRLFEIRGLLVHELILEFFSTFRFGEAVLDLDTAGALQFQLGGVRRRMSWREFILGMGLHTAEEIESVRFGAYWAESARDPMLRLRHRLTACIIVWRSQAPEKVTVTNLFYLGWMDVGSVNIPYMLARYLRLFALGKKQGAMISGDLPEIDMAELVRLQICVELDDTWAWVAPGPESTRADTLAATTYSRTSSDYGSEVRQGRGGRSWLCRRSAWDSRLELGTRAIQIIIFCRIQDLDSTRLTEASGGTYQVFDGTFRGSCLVVFERRTRQRIEDASTSTAQQDEQQPDP